MTYLNFKNLAVGQNLKWFYKSSLGGYQFTTYDGPLMFTCTIYGTACTILGATIDQEVVDDFEANYKANAINVE